MRRGPERSLGHADDRHAELSVHVSTQTRPAGGVQVRVAIDHDESQPA